MARTPRAPRQVETLVHDEAKRRNIPTAELETVMQPEDKAPILLHYERQSRNRDLDPQLVWRGKDERDWSDLVVQAPPLYIQEKVHPKVLIDDLLRETKERAKQTLADMPDLFGDFNGLPSHDAKTEFYQHDQNWSNRMILGDSLQVMASLAEREGLRGKVQCIYLDPPYGINFKSNFQWSTTSKDVGDGLADVTREPEQVRAFRDTWRDGVHSYLTYLRDRVTVARDLLSETGAVFVQIGDENVHRVRAVLDEVFGSQNYVTEIIAKKKGSQISGTLEPVNDFILMYAKDAARVKFRKLWLVREDSELFDDFPFVELSNGERIRISDLSEADDVEYTSDFDRFRETYPDAKLFALNPLKSGGYRKNQSRDFHFRGRVFPIGEGQCWKHTVISDDPNDTPGMTRVGLADRLFPLKTDVRFVRYSPSPSVKQMSNIWDGLGGAPKQVYVVQTNPELIKRCMLMVTDPGDLVLDPTCGSGTTAYVAEQWGRRWITIDTSRVAFALARARIMGARYPYYLLADSQEGRMTEGEITRVPPSSRPTHGDVRLGFVYDRVRSGTSGSIANNAEIDVIWGKWQERLEPLRTKLNVAVKQTWEEWQIPREPAEKWSTAAKAIHKEWWDLRIARQKEMDVSIAAKAEFEFLFDKPYVDNSRVRVAGPFTVETLSPHRVLAVDQDDELVPAGRGQVLNDGGTANPCDGATETRDFAAMILENLKTAGVQQAHKEDRITFTALTPWPGELICAIGTYREGDRERRAGIFIGPEFGTVSRPDLVAAAREAADANFDVLIACAFNYDAHSAEFEKLGRVPVLKARMNPDLHMGDELKNTGKGNLFVVFGEPDIDIEKVEGDKIRVKINGVDVFHPQTGEITSSGPDGIACWFIDTDYNEESFFVRHAYFLGTNDPYKALKTTLKAEIDSEAWESLHSDSSRPFPKPTSGRIAVKVINHLGDEVMKVFAVI